MSHSGTLRAKISYLGSFELPDGVRHQFKAEWLDPETNQVVWTETISPKDGVSFVSQVECKGEFNIRSGYFVDAEGKRHFVIRAETGKLGALIRPGKGTMSLLLALAIATAEIDQGNGVYGVFPQDAKAQYVAWAMSLVGPQRPLEVYR